MIELTGKDCPILFGKWQPDKTQCFYENERPPRIEQTHHFPFATVNVVSKSHGDVKYHNVKAHGNMFSANYSPDELFEPKILEMYQDAKRVIGQALKRNIRFADVDINKHSIFGRATGIHFDVDADKVTQPFEKPGILERNHLSMEVYRHLEGHIRGAFGINDEAIEDNWILGLVKSGTIKPLSLKNGVFIFAESPAEHAITAGSMNFSITSDENGNKKAHDDVVQFCRDRIDDFKAKLDDYNGRATSLGLSGDGSYWSIDLTNLFRKQLSADAESPSLLQLLQ